MPEVDVLPRLHLHDTGSGAPVLLLHAFPLDASMWDHQVAELSATHRCLRPDAPGCGETPAATTPFSVDGLAAAVLAALKRAGVDGPVPVAGLSMGGYVALALLRVAPERVSGLALVSTRATADGEAVRADRTALARRLRADGRTALEAIVEPQVGRLLGPHSRQEFHISDPVRGRIRRCSPEGVAALAEMMRDRPDSTGLLASVRVPTLVVAGADDEVVAPDEMKAMAAAIRGARFEVVPDSGHLVGVESPVRLSGLLGEWLTTVG